MRKSKYVNKWTFSINHKSTSEGPRAFKLGRHIHDIPCKKCAKFGVQSLINDVKMSIWENAKLSANARNHT